MIKKYDKVYIEDARKIIDKILRDSREGSDYTQFSLSLKDAASAAATVWGHDTDESIDKLRHFITEVTLKEIENLQEFEIIQKRL